MMKEELNNVEMNDLEAMELVCEEAVKDGKVNLGKLAIGVGVVFVGAMVAYGYKQRDKIEERKIEKLRKKGYVVYKNDEVVDVDDVTEVE